jgi:Protein of unknown function (DUF559)
LYVLQRGQLDGLSFRRQHPLGMYTVDFYCPAIRLAIELDGGHIMILVIKLATNGARACWKVKGLRSSASGTMMFWKT